MERFPALVRPIVALLREGFTHLRGVLNRVLITLSRDRVWPRSVLHISYMVHIPYYTVRLLREHGYRADYLAIGRSPTWEKADYCFDGHRWSVLRPFLEIWWFWTVVARYQIVHFHFMYTLSSSGWELPVLKALGRRIIVHFRGCEARDRTLNMALHPATNICQSCDYDPRICELPYSRLRREWAVRYGDVTLVTTPDMKDFVADALHLPFFAPDEKIIPLRSTPRWPQRRQMRIVHWTNHPGLEGTVDIQAAVNRLKARGYPIEFVFLRGVSHDRVLAECAQADLAVGKMKMGYYANAQIESLCCGVPTITYVRPEFVTQDILESGLILATLSTLEEVIADYMDHPERLAEKARIAKESVLRLHNNDTLTLQLIRLYEGRDGKTAEGTDVPSSCVEPVRACSKERSSM